MSRRGGVLPISVIVLTFNEEGNIGRTLDSVKAWADEIFVVDSGSTDRTLDIASRYTDNIFSHEFVNYAQQRNWTQANLPVANSWVFHLDADEQVSPELVAEMQETFCRGVEQVDGFLISRRTVFLGHWIRFGGHYPSYHLRLFRKEKGSCEARNYDQHFKVQGSIQRLRGDIVDHVTTDLRRWTLSHERWAAQEVQEFFSRRTLSVDPQGQVQGRLWGTPIERRRWIRERLYAKLPLFLRPCLYFFLRYVLLLGFLDGRAGLIFHFLQGFWFRFYIDAKIWEEKQHRAQHAVHS